MKRKSIKALSLVLLISMLLCHAPLAYAAVHTEDDYGQDKLYAFWQQEAYDGLNNGQAVYDHEWMDVFYWNGASEYNDTWYTAIVDQHSGYFNLSFYWERWYGFEEELEDGTILSGEGIDEIYPDLYGMLDLSETYIKSLNSPRADQTHITGIDLDNCPKLNYVTFNGQRHVTGFSALGSEKIKKLELYDSFFRSIAFCPEEANRPFEIAAFGLGSVGVYYDINAFSGADTAIIYAYADESPFKGWYSSGEMLYAHPVVTVTGGRYIACFGGDANDDGQINASDALFVLRAALGVGVLFDTNEADTDGSGTVTANDALEIMRFALGIY